MDEPIIQSNSNPSASFAGASADPIITGYDLTRYQYFLASPFYAGFDSFQNPKRKMFLEEFKQMSPNIRGFLTSVETAKTIFDAGQENQLGEDQIYQAAELFRDLVSGKIFIKDLPSVLAQKVSIDDAKASSVVNQIISKSFGSIIEDIKRIQRIKFPQKITQLQTDTRSQTQTMTQSTARPAIPRTAPTPGQQMASNQALPPMNPVLSQPQNRESIVIPQTGPQSMRPPLQMSRSEDRGSSMAMPSGPPRPSTPPEPQQAKPVVPPLSQMPPRIEVKPQELPPRPQFKIPDLSGLGSATPVSPSNPKQSLEAELDNIANVIDLRNKPEG